MTDYVAMVNRFGAEGAIGAMDCTYSSWATDRASGFADRRSRRARVPGALPRARDQGRLDRAHRRDPGRDLSRARRRPSRAARPHRARRRREDQRRAVVQRPARASPGSPTPRRPSRSSRCSTTTPMRSSSAIHGQGGEVLKFMGDGILAIFDAARAAGRLRLRARRRRRRDRARRRAEPAARGRRPAGHPLLSRPARRRGVLRQHRQRRPARLHRGRPGGQRDQPDRRHVPLARSGRAAVLGLRRGGRRRAAGRLVSVGRYALRGVQRPQELYTLDPEAAG